VQFGIFIYDGVEPIDLATFGVLSMARRIAPDIAISDSLTMSALTSEADTRASLRRVCCVPHKRTCHP
jgi:hypothetical protein